MGPHRNFDSEETTVSQPQVLTVLFSGHLSCFQVIYYVFQLPGHVFPLHVRFTQVTCSLSQPQLHVLTDHFPTVYSFHVNSQSGQNPTHLHMYTRTLVPTSHATDKFFDSCLHSLVIVLFFHSLVLFSVP